MLVPQFLEQSCSSEALACSGIVESGNTCKHKNVCVAQEFSIKNIEVVALH